MISPETTDFESHPIEGFTHANGGYFKVPIFSQIDGNLWMGGEPTGDLAKDFLCIVNLYGNPVYEVSSNQTFLLHILKDSAAQPLNHQHLTALAMFVNDMAAIGPTLVHCQAGLNRSGLLMAMTLMIRGHTASEAIEKLREKRCDQVLCNSHFEQWLRSH